MRFMVFHFAWHDLTCPDYCRLPLSDAALGGIIAGGLVVLWLLFVLVFYRRRSRNRLRASVGDVENRGLLPASHDSSRHRSVSFIHPLGSP